MTDIDLDELERLARAAQEHLRRWPTDWPSWYAWATGPEVLLPLIGRLRRAEGLMREAIERPQPRYVVRYVEQTCGNCPSQWEGVLDDGRAVYARYRHGCLTVQVSPEPGGSIEDAIRSDPVLEIEDGPDPGDGNGLLTYAQLRMATERAGFSWPLHGSWPEWGDKDGEPAKRQDRPERDEYEGDPSESVIYPPLRGEPPMRGVRIPGRD